MNFFATLCTGTLLPDSVAAAGISDYSDNFVWFVNTYPMVAFYVGLGVLLLIVLLLLRSRRRRRDVRVYQNDGGFAVVSQKALRHLIEIACEGAGLASSPKICFCEAKGRINVQIGARLFQSQRLSDVHALLQQRIHAAVEKTHGIQVGDVSIKVLGFRKDAHHHHEVDEAETDESVAVQTTPPEASAASLYEDPSTGETDDEGELATTDGAPHQATENAPKKRRFGFFGRQKAPVEDGLFVSGEQDPDAVVSDSEAGGSQVSTSEAADDVASQEDDEKPLR